MSVYTVVRRLPRTAKHVLQSAFHVLCAFVSARKRSECDDVTLAFGALSTITCCEGHTLPERSSHSRLSAWNVKKQLDILLNIV